MRAHWLIVLALTGLGACAVDDYVDDPADGTAFGDSKADGASTVDLKSMHLDIHLAHKTAAATIELEHAGNVSLEAGGLAISRVADDRGERRYQMKDGKLLVADVHGKLIVEYGYAIQSHDDGVLSTGVTILWPYYCGNLFPCHSEPADGITFSMALDGVPQGQTAVYPEKVTSEAPSYQLAFAVGGYTKRVLGTTGAGTTVSVYYLHDGEQLATAGTAHLVAAFDWLEQNIGPYSFGNDVASVSAIWGEGAYGGMEHHPYFHVDHYTMGDENTQIHEASHGWFGDGIRLRCWEDFVMSDGTVSYLSAHVLGKVAGPEAEAAVWESYEGRLSSAINTGGAPAWPTGCNQIDILKDHLFTNLPYMEGAFFYKDVAAQIGEDALDRVFHDFYMAHRGQAAGMQDMIDLIKTETGFDPSQLVADRLRKKF